MVAGAIENDTAPLAVLQRSGPAPIYWLGLQGGRRVAPQRVTHSLRDMNSKIVTGYRLLAVAQLGDCRHGPLQERLWDDHK